MPVESFKYLPHLIATFYRMTGRQSELSIPWTSLPPSLSDCKFGPVTLGGWKDK